MWRILFLILVLTCSTAFAQTKETKESYKFFEYEKISSELLEEKITSFCDEVDKTSWIGYIINYGNSNKINTREKQIRKTRMCTKEFPSPRITFLRIENKEKSKTEFWIVPPGEEPPPTKNK